MVITEMKAARLALCCCFVLSSIVTGQGGSVDEAGLRLGNFRISPELQVEGAYDRPHGENGAFFGETEARVGFDNLEARYDIGGSASYGYRAYEEGSGTNDYSALNDDFYGFSGKVGSWKSPLKIGFSGQLKKTVDYDVQVNDGTGSELGSILTRSASTRSSARFDLGYEKPIAGNSALLPSYEAWYYNQSFAGDPDAEWQEHTASLRYGYNLESMVVMSLSASYGMQISDIEDGSVVNVSLGAESKSQEKISWKTEVGISFADYEDSGRDQGLQGSMNMRWQATDKISTYVFGSASYQPGYAGAGGGSARRVCRVGYGGQWAILERLRIDGQILHDRQVSIQTDSSENRNFGNVQILYDIARRITVSFGGSYIQEDVDPDRLVLSAGASVRF